jgi:hypothetical protein
MIKKTLRVPGRRNVAFLQFTVRKKQKACVPGVPEGTRHVRLGLSPPYTVWSDMTLLISLQVSFLFIHCPANKAHFVLLRTFPSASCSPRFALRLFTLKQFIRRFWGFPWRDEQLLYCTCSWTTDPPSCFVIVLLSFYGFVLVYILFLLG